jgi:hypothetical protein
MEGRRAALYSIIANMQPMTVRQAFYQATVRGIVEKSEKGYGKIQRALVDMRWDGQVPYSWITDNTRWQRKPKTFNGIAQALEDTAAFYRKNLWQDADAYVEIWLEKDALSGVIYPITSQYDVPLMVARGYASLSFLQNAGAAINGMGVPAYIYHFGDFDPSGVNAAEKIEESLGKFAPDADIQFKRIALTPRQIRELKLPTRPTKKTDTRSKSFGELSVELDAIAPDDLRAMVQKVIEQHLPKERFEILKEAEASERQLLRSFVARAY